VVVTVVSRDPEVAGAIRARAARLADRSRRDAPIAEAAEQTRRRRCPVVTVGTSIDARDVPGGAAIAVRARVSVETDVLRREAHARAEAFR
jgi:uncharacterized lipoprotein YbaY